MSEHRRHAENGSDPSTRNGEPSALDGVTGNETPEWERSVLDAVIDDETTAALTGQPSPHGGPTPDLDKRAAASGGVAPGGLPAPRASVDPEGVVVTSDAHGPDPEDHSDNGNAPHGDSGHLDDEDRPPPTMWDQMGGPMGMVDSGLPVLVFVLVNAITSLTPAIYAALGAGLLIAIARVARRKPVTQAIAGLFGVGIAAFIAYRSGSAKGFFAFGIWSYVVYGSALIVSVLVRWPLIGVIWEGINGRGSVWRRDRKLVRRYDLATGVWIAIFAARYLVQDALYDGDQVGWLATAKIAMGYPLYFLGIGLTVLLVRGHKPAVTDDSPDAGPTTDAGPPPVDADPAPVDAATERTTEPRAAGYADPTSAKP